MALETQNSAISEQDVLLAGRALRSHYHESAAGRLQSLQALGMAPTGSSGCAPNEACGTTLYLTIYYTASTHQGFNGMHI